MNYIELINNFWAKAQKDDLKPIPIACWFALVHYCNQLNWLNPFVAHWNVVCQFGNFSKNSFYDAIKTLDELGYIKYKKGNRNQSLPKITILELKNNKGTVERIIKEQQQEHLKEHKGNLNKHINNQTDKQINRSFDHFTLTNKEYEDLCNEFNKSDVDDILDEIENYSGNKKYKSLKLTAKNWLKKRHDEKVSKNLQPHFPNPYKKGGLLR